MYLFVIVQVDAKDVSDVSNLQLLVSIAQRIMQANREKADEAMEKASKLSNRGDYERIKKENELLKQSLNSDEVETANRLQDYEEQLKDLKRILEQKEVELSSLRRKSDGMEGKLSSLVKENEFLKNEIESMKEGELDQRYELDDQLQDSEKYILDLRERNKKEQKLYDEIKSLENVKEELSQKVTELRLNLDEATRQLNLSSKDFKQLEQSYVSTHAMNESLLKEKEFFMKENADLQSKVDKMALDCAKCIDNMTKILAEKDVEINQLKESTMATRPSSSSAYHQPLTGSFDSAKELELNQVKIKFQEATTQLEVQNKMIEELQKELQEVRQLTPRKGTVGRQHPDSFSTPIYDAKIHELNESIQQLEEELKSKDGELTKIKEQNKLYEKGKYGLVDAMNELRNERQKLMKKESEVEELVKELNALKSNLNDAEEELEYIRECAQKQGIDPTYDPKSSKQQNDRLKVHKLEQELVELEGRHLSLQEELRELKNKYRPSLEMGEVTTATRTTETDQSPEMVHYLNEKLKEVKEENDQLILGMREVLNILRVSDSKSDVVVECPSLERILTYFESRSVTSTASPSAISEQELMDLITLKSELDLVRGQNEQLRSEMKVLRNERKNLLSYCTQHILNENNSSSTCGSNTTDEDPLLDMSEGEVFPLSEPKGGQDTAAASIDGDDDVIITKEEILGKGIKLVISEVLNGTSNEEEDEEGDEEESGHEESKQSNVVQSLDEPNVIGHEGSSQHETGQEISGKDEKKVIKGKVPCTKCPKAFAALEEVLKRMNKITSIIKQREQDRKSSSMAIAQSITNTTETFQL